MKNTLIILTIIILQSCSGSEWKNIQIKKNISELVSQNIVDTFDNSKLCIYEFTNKSMPTFYVNDTLSKSNNRSTASEWFEAKWLIKEDTTFIVGGNVMHDGARGFKANLVNRKSKVDGFIIRIIHLIGKICGNGSLDIDLFA